VSNTDVLPPLMAGREGKHTQLLQNIQLYSTTKLHRNIICWHTWSMTHFLQKQIHCVRYYTHQLPTH